MGIVLPEVYDGISVWQEPDGTFTNRWADLAEEHPAERLYRWRAERAQEWIAERTGGGER